MEDSALIASLGVVSAVVAALVWVLKQQFMLNVDTLTKVAKSSEQLSKSIVKLADAGENQNKAIERRAAADKEWQEYVRQEFTALRHTGDTIITKIDSQTVSEQTVKHQTVIKKD